MIPRVSVLLTSYNRPETLGRAIESVTAQTFTDWELLVLDDGSSDDRVQRVIEEHESDERLWPIYFDTTLAEREQSCMYAKNINWGVRSHSHGEFITYLCDDDYYYPRRLERMVAKLDEGNDVVYGTQDMLDTEGHLLARRMAEDRLKSAANRVDLNSVCHSRASFDKAKGFPTDSALWRTADGAFWTRLCNAGYTFVPVDDPEHATEAKVYGSHSVDLNVRGGREPWAPAVPVR